MNYLVDNLGNIVVIAVLILITVLIIRKLVRDKKSGKSACGCNCGHCAMSGSCHKNTASK